MAVITPLKKAQVVDFHLTGLAQSVRVPGSYMYDSVLGVARSSKINNVYLEWNADAYRKYESDRGLGEKTKRVNFDYQKKSFNFPEGFGLSVPIDDREDIQTIGVGNLNFAKQKLSLLKHPMVIAREIATANLVTNVANYGSTQAATGNWAVDEDIATDVDNAREKVRAKVGLKPDTAWCTPKVANRLKRNEVIKDSYKYTQKGPLSLAAVAEELGLKEIIVCDATVMNGAVASNIWGDAGFGLICKNSLESNLPVNPEDLPPSFAWFMIYAPMDLKVRRFRDDDATSDIWAIDDNFYLLQTAKDAGCFITGLS